MELTPFGAPFETVEELPSTNTYLLEHLDTLPHGTAVLAKRQTAGKGRLSRVWDSHGDGLYFSFLLKDMPVRALQALPCACAVAVCRALSYFDVTGWGIKWPNDVVLGNQKICGILCESRLTDGQAQVVCGIGVNLTQPQAYFIQNSLPHATSVLAYSEKTLPPLALAQAVLLAVRPLVEQCKGEAPYPFHQEYVQNCLNIGRQVRLILDGNEQVALAKGVAEDFSLICEINGRETNILAGEVSVRGLYGYV